MIPKDFTRISASKTGRSGGTLELIDITHIANN
jgi:hypothetical protein